MGLLQLSTSVEALPCPNPEQPLASAFVVPHPSRPNEDTFCICPLWLNALGLVSFYGVYDGHSGSDVSRFLASSLHHYVVAYGTIASDAATALSKAFHAADAALETVTLNCPSAGSTATVALLSSTQITVAHCGDSRALLCRGGRVKALTEDHRPTRQDERERVLRSGGQILWNEGERVMGVLATTRAFGDRDLKQFGVTAEPEVACCARCPDDEFLILATDGVFNVLSNEEVADVARRIVRRAQERGSPRAAAIRTAASAIGRFSRDRNSKDDITVVVVDLQATPPPSQVDPALPPPAAVTPAAAAAAAGAPGLAAPVPVAPYCPWNPVGQVEPAATAALGAAAGPAAAAANAARVVAAPATPPLPTQTIPFWPPAGASAEQQLQPPPPPPPLAEQPCLQPPQQQSYPPELGCPVQVCEGEGAPSARAAALDCSPPGISPGPPFGCADPVAFASARIHLPSAPEVLDAEAANAEGYRHRAGLLGRRLAAAAAESACVPMWVEGAHPNLENHQQLGFAEGERQPPEQRQQAAGEVKRHATWDAGALSPSTSTQAVQASQHHRGYPVGTLAAPFHPATPEASPPEQVLASSGDEGCLAAGSAAGEGAAGAGPSAADGAASILEALQQGPGVAPSGGMAAVWPPPTAHQDAQATRIAGAPHAPHPQQALQQCPHHHQHKRQQQGQQQLQHQHQHQQQQKHHQVGSPAARSSQDNASLARPIRLARVLRPAVRHASAEPADRNPLTEPVTVPVSGGTLTGNPGAGGKQGTPPGQTVSAPAVVRVPLGDWGGGAPSAAVRYSYGSGRVEGLRSELPPPQQQGMVCVVAPGGGCTTAGVVLQQPAMVGADGAGPGGLQRTRSVAAVAVGVRGGVLHR